MLTKDTRRSLLADDAYYARVQDRIAALDHALWQRATDASGLGEGRNVWHNAMVARECGAPWREVNYSNLRRALRIDNRVRGELSRIRGAILHARCVALYPETYAPQPRKRSTPIIGAQSCSVVLP